MPTRIVRTARGEQVNFDAILIKQQLAQAEIEQAAMVVKLTPVPLLDEKQATAPTKGK